MTATAYSKKMPKALLTPLLVGTVSALAFLPAVGSAQVQQEVDPLEDFRTTDGASGLFEGTDDGSGADLYQLIHRMQLGNGTTMEDFSRQRQENITTEADNFRQLQLERMRQQTTPEAESANSAEPE
ncbi:MAG: hypothetical protein VKK04_16700 [Synechococcales bacterium]|nr:hypothetical protein [Synechococcales bacterium]